MWGVTSSPPRGVRERCGISVSFVLTPGWEQCAFRIVHLDEGPAGSISFTRGLGGQLGGGSSRIACRAPRAVRETGGALC